MRNTDPFDFFRDHRDTIFRWLGIVGAVLVVFLLLRWWAMRKGGWKAWWRWLCREVALTANAFAAPVRAWSRHRGDLRLLVRLLRNPTTWRDAERALSAARIAAAPARPYAAIVGPRTVSVLLAGANIPAPKGIWGVVPGEDGHLWTTARTELPSATPEADGARPVVAALGTTERRCAFLDLSVGPPMVGVDGDRRSRHAVLQALAAQVDARLPESLVVVAEGVHPAFRGIPVRDAYREARRTPPRLDIPPVLVAAELPDPLPTDLDAPGLRVLVQGEGRGHVRALLTDRRGQLAVVGTPLLVRCTALGLAVARVLRHIPPVLPPAPAATALPGGASAGLFEEEPATVPHAGPTTGTDPDAWHDFAESTVGASSPARARSAEATAPAPPPAAPVSSTRPSAAAESAPQARTSTPAGPTRTPGT
ncbi:hypothetical protein LO772_03850 [Yinghuangia sp. ASG 101]|uniref:hypothetical protein n=1 Tax=Yinghuangia sp. ASG 101 TaxID=2896848 RepID=UPI001E415DA0|nr:hypothetical protein [Yinghuangia sp. ASG 101]UGQ12766.1 hypothetical protein LO772_03850 [Yinghuangia sp. ASG 101]